eukprot:7924875-Karenia_brevis.AAC.1
MLEQSIVREASDTIDNNFKHTPGHVVGNHTSAYFSKNSFEDDSEDNNSEGESDWELSANEASS